MKKRRLIKIIFVVLVILLFIPLGGYIYLYAAFPKVGPAPKITIEKTPARVARGRYLANHVSVCMDCHSERDWRYFGGPIR